MFQATRCQQPDIRISEIRINPVKIYIRGRRRFHFSILAGQSLNIMVNMRGNMTEWVFQVTRVAIQLILMGKPCQMAGVKAAFH